MIARSKFLSDFAVAAASAMGIGATVGAIWTLDPASGIVPMLLIGGAVAAVLLELAGTGPAARNSASSMDHGVVRLLRVSIPGVLFFTLVLWGPGLDAVSATVSRLLGLRLGGAAVPFAVGAAMTWLWRRRGGPVHRPTTGRSLLLTGALSPIAVVSGLPLLGAAAIATIAAVLLVVSAALPQPPTEVEGEPSGRTAGFVAGLLVGGLACVHLAAVPWISPDPVLAAWLVGGALIGLGLGRGLALPVAAAAGLPALGFAVGAELPPWLPAIAEGLLRGADAREALAYQLPAIVVLLPGLVAGLGAGALSRGARSMDVALGLATGLVIHRALPGLLGGEETLHALVVVAAVAAFPIALTSATPARRVVVLLVPALATASVFLSAPAGAGLAAFAPWTAYANGADLATIERAAATSDVVIAGSSDGSIALALGGDGPAVAQVGGARIGWSTSEVHADRFFGHLPLLLLRDEPARLLVLGLGSGHALDALRRTTAAQIDVHEPNRHWTGVLADRSPLLRGVLADPAIRTLAVSPLGANGRYDAILVDLPPPWTVGAGAVLATGRLRAVRDGLMRDGVAVFRITLADVSADDLARAAHQIGGEFGTLVAWLDPLAADHLLLTAWAERRRVPVAAMLAGWERPSVQRDLVAAGLPEVVDVLERALSDRDGLVLLADRTAGRDAAGAAVLGGSRVRRSRASVALSILAEAGRSPELLFDFEGIPTDVAAPLRERLEAGTQTRTSYLQLLGYLAEGKSKEAMGLAVQLSSSSANPSRDLRSLVAPWLRRGKAQLQAGRLEAARSELLTAWQFSPRDRDVNLALARTYLRLGLMDDALRHARALLDDDPGDVEATLVLADIRVAQGKLAEAVTLLEAAEPLYPGNERLLTNLGYLLTQLAVGSDETIRRRLARGRVLFQRAAALAPALSQPRAGLAEVYYRLGEQDLALREIDRALSLEESCHYRSSRGHILAARGELPVAEAELQRALLECPDAIEALVMLGAVLADQRKFVEARQSWERALAVDPGNSAAQANLDTLDARGLESLGEGGGGP